MTTHQVNLEYLAEAANLLMGPQGALRLSVVYAAIERVSDRAYIDGNKDGQDQGYKVGYVQGSVDNAKGFALKQQQEEAEEIAEAYRVADEMFDPSEYTPVVYYTDATVTINEAAHGDDDVADIDLHKTHYDTWNGRFHRPGEE